MSCMLHRRKVPVLYDFDVPATRAGRLILQGRPLSAVATGSDFYDQPHLVRHFKRILGVSPVAFARPTMA